MDSDLNASFGQLNMGAAEWTPNKSPASDLNATAVKEFVPGRGWSESKNIATENPPPPPSEQPVTPLETTIPAAPRNLGMHEDLWRYHREINLLNCRQMPPTDPRHKAVPLPYCNANILDEGRSSSGYLCSTFQVLNREDGNLYCLKRFDNVRSVSVKIAQTITESFRRLTHPGMVDFKICFLSQRAVFFVHEFVPGARTLSELLTGPIPETIVWSCIVQVVSLVRYLHQNNLAVRNLHLRHLLSNADSLNTRLRLRVNGIGTTDALEFEARKQLVNLQMEDMRDLGRLIMSLATGKEVHPKMDAAHFRRCEHFMASNYSRELHGLTMALIQAAPRPPTIMDVSKAISGHCFDEQDASYRALDRSERSLHSEYNAGRALRLLLKLGFINERPEFGQNRRWTNSGNCYVLTLFRDYVFHQADGAGNPVLDLGHVVTALNKLDAADEEKIVLASRDGKSLMVVSYADVAQCLESAFIELCNGSVPPSALQY